MESVDLIGTRLKQVQDALDGGLAEVYAELGLPGFRLRYTPVLQALQAQDGQSIGELATAVGVTHSAMSQTVAALLKDALVLSSQGRDARSRLIRLSDDAKKLMPLLDEEWRSTAIMARQLESEMSFPLSTALDEVLQLLTERPYRERFAAARAQVPARIDESTTR
ncbi:MarR family winged helix-turn-helix transcriptional regulator [Psychromicrobium lacuslunae]|uniref:MarR family transcriptional regulator n=1 Tax=Psychromicrobium lacuslunae TaxID=1618207 RepID=A0A0D4C1P1_9MICC|nr:MarR family transcriptional regulator [Psychromicrobium lacuslunae]AJT42325.1 MarR family transcriptional regulator [Psychromicrobium lacuslunae]